MASEEFQHFCVVRQEHLNQYGSLFGGHLLAVIDELAFVACERTWPGRNFVTKALEDVVFHAPAHLGDILESYAKIEHLGRTSCRVRIRVFICAGREKQRELCFDGFVVLVRVDENGTPMPIVPDEK